MRTITSRQREASTTRSNVSRGERGLAGGPARAPFSSVARTSAGALAILTGVAVGTDVAVAVAVATAIGVGVAEGTALADTKGAA
jgi:hypothetical protein